MYAVYTCSSTNGLRQVCSTCVKNLYFLNSHIRPITRRLERGEEKNARNHFSSAPISQTNYNIMNKTHLSVNSLTPDFSLIMSLGTMRLGWNKEFMHKSIHAWFHGCLCAWLYKALNWHWVSDFCYLHKLAWKTCLSAYKANALALSILSYV